MKSLIKGAQVPFKTIKRLVGDQLDDIWIMLILNRKNLLLPLVMKWMACCSALSSNTIKDNYLVPLRGTQVWPST